MKMGKILVLILVFILILPSISLVASSQGGNGNGVSSKSLIYKLLKLHFDLRFLKSLSMGRYFVQQLRPPTPIQSYPESVSLKYLNETTFQIGGKNINNTDWNSLVFLSGGWSWAWMDKKVVFSFEFVPPDNTSKDIWNVRFDPPQLTLDTNRKDLNWPGAETPFKTNVTIMLKPSVDPSIVTQDTVLKVNVVKEEVLDKFALLKGTPEFFKTHKEEYIQKCEKSGEYPYFTKNPITIPEYNLLTKYFLFLANLQFPFDDKNVDSTVEVLIKVNKYHLAEIKAPPLPIEIEPYEVKSIPVTIKNIGSHIDTYNFRVNCSDENIVVTPPPAITLKPGEEGQALVGVAAPRTFSAAGFITSINVSAYSADDPETIFYNTITLKTSGIYATGETTYNGALLLAILFVLVAMYMYFLRKRREKICKKPEKPWETPEEKNYLEKLKEKNKEEYNKVLEMMKEEHESSLLWYKSYVKAMMEKERREKQKAKTDAAKEKKLTEKPKTKKIEEKKSIVTKEEKIEKTSEKPDEKIELESLEERKKQEAILRIKQEQEKQKKKFKP